ncbi:hypothetical protein MRX96_025276 [Rhipicephalus microplus]
MKYLHAVHENQTGPQSVAGAQTSWLHASPLSPLFHQSRRLLAPLAGELQGRGERRALHVRRLRRERVPERRRHGEGSGEAQRRSAKGRASEASGCPCPECRWSFERGCSDPSVHAADRQRPRRRGRLHRPPIAPTPARKLRKATEVTQPEAENPSASKEVAGKAPRITRAKRSRSSSSKSPNDTASEAPKRHRSKKVSRSQSTHSSRSRHIGQARKARGRRSSSAPSEASHPRKRRTRSHRHVRSIASSSTTIRRSKRDKKRRHTRSRSSSRHGGRHGKARSAPSSRSSSVRGRRTRTGKTSKNGQKK